MQMKGSDSDWMGMTNKYGQAWEVPVTPKLPWDFRMVSDDSQEVSHRPPNLLQTASSEAAQSCYFAQAETTACAVVLRMHSGSLRTFSSQ